MSGGGAKALAIRVIITTAALVIWFWTQSLIGARPAPANGIGDGLQTVTAPLNLYLQSNP